MKSSDWYIGTKCNMEKELNEAKYLCLIIVFVVFVCCVENVSVIKMHYFCHSRWVVGFLSLYFFNALLN